MGVTPYYSDDLVTIWHADWRDVPGLEGADLLLTDPPYGIRSVRPDGTMGGSTTGPLNRIYKPVHGDDEPLDPTPLLRLAKRRIIWGAHHFVVHPIGGRLLVWDKRDGLPSNDHSDAEVAWDSEPGPVRVFHHRQMGMVTDGYGDVGRVHPNQKPLALMAWCLSLVPDARTVLDPYMGSGTTLVAAKARGLRAVGVDVERDYCALAASRCSQEVLGLTA